METIKDLQNILPQTGIIEIISYRTKKKGDILVAESLGISVEHGIDGDYQSKKGARRMVTLIQKEHLQVVSSIIGKEVSLQQTRRNLLISGINLLALHNRLFRLGNEVILQGTGYCVPCSQMEKNLGPGGFNAMRGHGGITASVVKSGLIKVGDNVALIKEALDN